jgi:hypothetical protein
MKFSSSSGGGALMLLARFSSLGHAVFLLLCFGSRCLSLLELDVSLYSSQYDLLDALLFSSLLLSSFFFLSRILFVLMQGVLISH